MRCQMCGHESPAGSSFCLNCGSSLAPAPAPAAFIPTPTPAAGLPVMCTVCRGENPPGMKFCRSCGAALAAPGTLAGPGIGGGAQNMGYGGAPMGGAPGNPPPMNPMTPMMPPPGPLGAPMSPMGAPPMPPPMGAPPMGAPPMGAPPMGGPPMGGPISPSALMSGGGGAGAMGYAPTAPPANAPMPSAPVNSPMFAPTMAQDGPSTSGPAAAGASGMINCPRCGTATPVGFAYCQQCGLHMTALQPTDPGANARPRPASSGGPGTLGSSGAISGARPASSPAIGAPPSADGHAMTLATDAGRPAPVIRPPVQAAPAWGTAVLVNRDGTDGQRFSLAGEYCVVGRAGADIAFDDDRFLARQHARFERGSDGTVKVEALDALNGVFRKADLPVELVDGTVVLVGREVLRFEKVDAEEVKVHPLVRHGVALFGSPPREPWGRLVQIIPSGGYRDVRHLVGEEVVLGREEGDIVFRDDAFMSRRHAAITWDGRKAQITDLGSSNGTFVRITQPTPIKHGDHVRMGDQLLRIELGK